MQLSSARRERGRGQAGPGGGAAPRRRGLLQPLSHEHDRSQSWSQVPSQEWGFGSSPPPSHLLPARAREWVQEAAASLRAFGGEGQDAAHSCRCSYNLLRRSRCRTPRRISPSCWHTCSVPNTRPTTTRRRSIPRRRSGSTPTGCCSSRNPHASSWCGDGGRRSRRWSATPCSRRRRSRVARGQSTPSRRSRSRLRRLCSRPPPPRRRSAAATAPSASRSGRSPPRAPAARRREIGGIAPSTCGRRARRVGGGTF